MTAEEMKQPNPGIDEVNYCVRIAQEQLPYFRKKSKIAELCYELSKTFAEILLANS